MFPDEFRVDDNPQSWISGDFDLPVDHLQRGGGTFEWNMRLQSLEFMMFPCIGQYRYKMNVVEVPQSAARHVGGTLFPEGMGHAGDLHGADESAKIVIVGLNDLQTIVGN